MLVPALIVIGEHLDDAAFADLTVAAIVEHVPQLRAEELQLGDAPLDVSQVPQHDLVGRLAGLFRLRGEAQQLADRIDLEAEIARMADEAEADTSSAP